MEASKPKDLDLDSLPGWASGGGMGLKPSAKKRRGKYRKESPFEGHQVLPLHPRVSSLPF